MSSRDLIPWQDTRTIGPPTAARRYAPLVCVLYSWKYFVTTSIHIIKHVLWIRPYRHSSIQDDKHGRQYTAQVMKSVHTLFLVLICCDLPKGYGKNIEISQCQWSNHKGYGSNRLVSNHNKTQTVYFLWYVVIFLCVTHSSTVTSCQRHGVSNHSKPDNLVEHVQTGIKGNMKDPRYRHFVWGIHGWPVDSL